MLGVGICLIAANFSQAAEDKIPAPGTVEAVADQLEYDRGGKKIVGRGNVVVSYGEMKLTADYAEVETETKKAYARGHVLLMRGDLLAAKGEEATYDFASDTGRFPNGKSVGLPWFTEGKMVEQVGKGKYHIDDAGITTCDLERPHYQLRAKRVTVKTGDKIIARDVTLHILGKKVFWLPYAVIPLQQTQKSPLQVQPGYSSEDGAYVLVSKGFSLAKSLGGEWHTDWRAKRGFGAGVDFNYHFDQPGTEGALQTYLTQDEDAPTPGFLNPYAEREDRVRGRVTWRHRTDFDPDTNLLLRYNRLADEFFLQDFFEQEFRSEVEPQSFATFTHNSDHYGAYVFNQKRMNKFENTTERLPEIRFDWKNAPFASERLYYESSTSFANLNQTISRSDEDFNAVRFDTLHEWTRPMKRNEFKLTPSVNMRETLYSRKADRDVAKARTAFGAAVDLRTQFYRMFEASGDFLGIEVNQLRHVFEPSVRYDSVLHSSVSNEELKKFDSIDSVDDSNRMIFGFENRIQTKRMIDGKMRRVDLVSLNTFLSYDFHPDEEFSRGGFSILEGEFQFRPYDWLQFEIRSEYDMTRDRFRELNQDLLIRKGRLRVLFGHRWVPSRKFLNAEGNNQFVFDASWWLNTRWQIGGYVRFDQEKHEMQEWQISWTRDLHDFLLDFGYNVRNSDIDNSNKELFFLLRLKAYPEYDLKSGNRASFGEPRIGTTVAGSNSVQVPRYGAAEV